MWTTHGYSQLINKTNQFNMNGVRRESDEIISVISNGGKLLSQSLWTIQVHTERL